MTESSRIQIRWTDEQLAFIDEARGDQGFAEYVRDAVLERAAKKLRRKPPETRGRGRPKKS